MPKWTTSLLALGLSLFLTAALPAAAQNQPGQDNNNPNNNNNNGGRRGGNRGNFDPAQMRAQYMDRIKQALEVKDDEWTAIQPRLEKVMDAQRDTRGGGGRGNFGRRGGADQQQQQPSNRPETEVSKAQQELRTALDNKDTPPAEIAAKLKALRDAREKARGSLAQAQKELKDLLTQRQEAVLVNMGMLD